MSARETGPCVIPESSSAVRVTFFATHVLFSPVSCRGMWVGAAGNRPGIG